MTSAVSGFGYFLKGLSLIFKPGVKRYVAIPLLINFTIFFLLILLFGNLVTEQIEKLIPSDWPEWVAWLEGFLEILLTVLFYLLAVLIMFFTFSFVANVIGAPFNGYLAAAVERHLTGKTPPGSDRNLMAEFVVIMLSELKKWLYYFMFAIPLAIISGILIVTVILSPVVPFIWFLFGAWMYSIEYADYPMGNYGLTFSEIRKEVAKKRLLSLGYGSGVTLGTMIPLFNFIIMPVAVAGATAMRVEQFPMQPK